MRAHDLRRAPDRLEPHRSRPFIDAQVLASRSTARSTPRLLVSDRTSTTPVRLRIHRSQAGSNARCTAGHSSLATHGRLYSSPPAAFSEARPCSRRCSYRAARDGAAVGPLPRSRSPTPTRSSRAIPPPARWASRSSRTTSRSARSCRGSRPASAPSPPSRWCSSTTAPTVSRSCAQGLTAQAGARLADRADPNPSVRQVAMVDARGQRRRAHGPKCIPDAGHQSGRQYSVQANLMANPRCGPRWRRPTRARRAISPSA